MLPRSRNKIEKINPWRKSKRRKLSKKNLLIIGTGNIGSRVAHLMKKFTTVTTYDVLQNSIIELELYIRNADCISIHIPKVDNNIDCGWDEISELDVENTFHLE